MEIYSAVLPEERSRIRVYLFFFLLRVVCIEMLVQNDRMTVHLNEN